MKAMAKHRTYSIEFKRQVAQEYIAGETLHPGFPRWFYQSAANGSTMVIRARFRP